MMELEQMSEANKLGGRKGLASGSQQSNSSGQIPKHRIHDVEFEMAPKTDFLFLYKIYL